MTEMTEQLTTGISSLNALRVIAWAGLTAGVLDISSAFTLFRLRGIAPKQVLQGIAGGLLGPASFHGGNKTAFLGAALHFFIALVGSNLLHRQPQIRRHGSACCPVRNPLRNRRAPLHEPHRGAAVPRAPPIFSRHVCNPAPHPHVLRRPAHCAGRPPFFQNSLEIAYSPHGRSRSTAPRLCLI